MGNILCATCTAQTAATEDQQPELGIIDGEPMRIEQMRETITNLKQIHERMKGEIVRLQTSFEEKLDAKDKEIRSLRAKLEELKAIGAPEEDIRDVAKKKKEMGSFGAKKMGVCAAVPDIKQNDYMNIKLEKHPKSDAAKQLIKTALQNNEFLKHIDAGQLQEMTDCMYPKTYKAKEVVINEGDTGNEMFVIEDGKLEVTIKDDKGGPKFIRNMESATAFGELALLYNCQRTASVRVTREGPARIWVLDRSVFQSVMISTGMQKQDNLLKKVAKVTVLNTLPPDKLLKVSDALEVEYYQAGEYIVREGTAAETFYIINKGMVKVTVPDAQHREKEVRTLHPGDYFGERALLDCDKRTANCIAMPPGVECLTLDSEPFQQLIGRLDDFTGKHYIDKGDVQLDKTSSSPTSDSKMTATTVAQLPTPLTSDLDVRPTVKTSEDERNANIKLQDLEIITTLGMGGFGRVELVVLRNDRQQPKFALKCLNLEHVVQTRQQEHILSERNILTEARSPFICRLYNAYRDTKFFYMLLEVCLGGELWTILQEKGVFDDTTAQFYAGCVTEALDYLHTRRIVYRDLKPENLMLDHLGYLKLVDFGFAKKLSYGRKTWTFCGTSEYMAPELILNKGHDQAVDYWALGVLIYELLAGEPPFTGPNPMKVYNLILKGIDFLTFPKMIGKNAQNLIKRLCRELPTERVGNLRNGVNDIRRNKWFHALNWDSLANRTVDPPIVPELSSKAMSKRFRMDAPV